MESIRNSHAPRNSKQGDSGKVFRSLPPRPDLVAVACKVLGRTAHQIETYGRPEQSRNYRGDILVRLLNRPNVWTDKLTLIRTANDGLQMMSNTRFHELRTALKPHGFSIACLEDHSHSPRRTSYRLCWEDEISFAENGRIEPYIVGRTARKTARKSRPALEVRPHATLAPASDLLTSQPITGQLSFAEREMGVQR